MVLTAISIRALEPAPQVIGGTGCRYPPAINANSGDLTTIQNVRIEGAWDGITRCPATIVAYWCNANTGSGNGGGYSFNGVEIGAIDVGLGVDNVHDSGNVTDLKCHPRWTGQPNELNSRDIIQLDIYTDGNTRCEKLGATDGGVFIDLNSFQSALELVGGSDTGGNTGWSYGQFHAVDEDGGGGIIIDQDLPGKSYIWSIFDGVYTGTYTYASGDGCIIDVNESTSTTQFNNIHTAQASSAIFCAGGGLSGQITVANSVFAAALPT